MSVLDEARTIAIAALNEAHMAHGMKEIMECKFCTSMAAEMTIARHIEPLLLRLDDFTKLVTVEKNAELQSSLNSAVHDRDVFASQSARYLSERDEALRRLDELRKLALDWYHGEDCDGYVIGPIEHGEQLECTCGVGDVLRATIPGCKVFVDGGERMGLSRVVETRCPVCIGNDADTPCAYPGKGAPGCLRDARLAASAVERREP